MKIVCGSCGAKYSIADEKVQGRVFKIRCKKCSDVIVVKGTTDGADAREAEADYSSAYGHSGGASEWYVVIDGEQVGPITPEEVEAYYTVGQLTAESFVWREGLGDWVMINTLDEFAHLTHDTAGPNEQTMIAHHHRDVAHSAAGDETAVIQSGQFQSAVSAGDDATFGYGESATADAYSQPGEATATAASSDSGYGGSGFESQAFGADAGYDSGGGSFQSFNAPASEPAANFDSGYGGSDESYDSDGGGGMFAAFDSTPADDSDYGGGFGGGYGDQDSGANEVAGSANELVGARNENSVLFSLSSLDQVKAVSKPASDSGPGAAQGNDKSGLIDIQALASAHATMKSGNAAGTDDAAFVPPSMSMPALMPMPMGSHRNNKGLIIGVSIGGAVLLIGIAAVIVLLLNNQNQQPTQIIEQVVAEQPAQAPAQVDEKAAEEARAAAERALAESSKPAEPEEAEEEAPEEKQAETKTAEKKAQASNTRASGSSTTRSSTTRAASSTPDPAPRTARTTKKSGGIDDILGQIDTKKSDGGSKTAGGSPAPAAPAANVPEKLSRTMVQNTVRQYNGQVMRCHQTSNSGNLSGTVTVRFTVQPSGSVSAAGVQGGEFRGTDLGTCIEGVVRSMKFPASKSDLTINYPFIVR